MPEQADRTDSTSAGREGDCVERGGPCHILGPSRTGLILPKAQSRQQRGGRWISHSQMPTRTLPNTPRPSTLMRNTGLELLENASSRSPRPCAAHPGGTAPPWSGDRWGSRPPVPAAARELPTPSTRNSGSINPASQGAASSARKERVPRADAEPLLRARH